MGISFNSNFNSEKKYIFVAKFIDHNGFMKQNANMLMR